MASISPSLPFIPDYAGGSTYLNISPTIRSWLLTKDHKRIAILYLFSITLFFFIGGGAATLIRINLLTPTGLLVDEASYNKLFTIHGVVMVWFFLIPSIPTTLGHFLIPLPEIWRFPGSTSSVGICSSFPAFSPLP
jgi:cytochrome c oxidase subunit 1